MRLSSLILLAAPPLLLGACASTPEDDIAQGDPLEGVNRPIYDFNEAVATHVLLPAADAVESRTSEGGRSTGGEALYRVGNVLDNLSEPKNVLNNAFQGDAGGAGASAARFGLNSTVGLLGVFDVATGFGIEERDEDFGQTLGRWGAPPGPYMVAPVAGPTSTRDVAGAVVDSVLNPLSVVPLPAGDAVTAARMGVNAAGAVGDARNMEARAGDTDPYATARTRYEAERDAAVTNADRLAPRPDMAPIEYRSVIAMESPPLRRAGGPGPDEPVTEPLGLPNMTPYAETAGGDGGLTGMTPYEEARDRDGALPARITAGGPLEIDIYPAEDEPED